MEAQGLVVSDVFALTGSGDSKTWSCYISWSLGDDTVATSESAAITSAAAVMCLCCRAALSSGECILVKPVLHYIGGGHCTHVSISTNLHTCDCSDTGQCCVLVL